MISKELENSILKSLPYSKPFLFVDKILEVNEKEIFGHYTFRLDEPFYSGHFINQPVTPGVILVEAMGQIGLVSFGVFLLDIYKTNKSYFPYLSHIDADFYEPVFPGESVTVHSVKEYLTNNILKCKIKMINSRNNIVLTKTAICTFKMLTA